MLEPILQQVGAGNPQLAQLIQEHPEQFLQLLSEEADNDAPAPPGAQEVFVTEEEREAIDRVSVVVVHQLSTVTNCISFVASASSETWSSRRILPATRTKSWPQISSLISRLKRMKTNLGYNNPIQRGPIAIESDPPSNGERIQHLASNISEWEGSSRHGY